MKSRNSQPALICLRDSSFLSVATWLSPSPNIAYTANFVRPNFGYAETSYMLKLLGEIGRICSIVGGRYGNII